MIRGYFTEVDIPQVRVDEDIKATIGFYALNPGAYYWSTFLIVDSAGLPLVKMLDKARETFPEGGREKTYSLGKMPDLRNVGISFFLFAHDDAGYDWDWAEYERWKIGFAVNLTYLGSAYRFISPIAEDPEPPPEEPPEGARLSGAITGVAPTEFAYGDPVDLSIDFKAYVETIWEQTRGWDTRLTATLNGLSDSDIQHHIGREGHRTGETLNLGAMPNKSISGTIVLEGRGKNLFLLPTEWKELDRNRLTISLAPAPTPPPTPPEDETGFSGLITSVAPAEILYGTPLDLSISFNAYADNVTDQIAGWETRLTATLDSLSDFDRQNHIGREGHRTGQTLHLGNMPNRSLSGQVVLEAKGLIGQWVEIDRRSISVKVSSVPVPPPPPEPVPTTCSIDADCPEGYKCKDGKCVKKEWPPWLVPALIVGAAVLLLPGKPAKKGK